MQKLILAAALLLLLNVHATAQTDTDIDRQELKNLLDERKEKFDSYSLSIQKHSGIFGNKTKNDIKKSNEVLIDIVKTDNRIISTLNRVVDFRTYQKVNMNYDLQKNDELLNNLRHATDTLSKQVAALKTANHALNSKTTQLKWLIYTLCILIIWSLIAHWRKRAANSKG